MSSVITKGGWASEWRPCGKTGRRTDGRMHIWMDRWPGGWMQLAVIQTSTFIQDLVDRIMEPPSTAH